MSCVEIYRAIFAVCTFESIVLYLPVRSRYTWISRSSFNSRFFITRYRFFRFSNLERFARVLPEEAVIFRINIFISSETFECLQQLRYEKRGDASPNADRCESIETETRRSALSESHRAGFDSSRIRLRLSYREFPLKEIYSLRVYFLFLAKEVSSHLLLLTSKCIFRRPKVFPLARSLRNPAAYDGCEPMDHCVFPHAPLVACCVGGFAKRNGKKSSSASFLDVV